MERQYYLDLAGRGLRMPVGVDLILHEKPDVDSIVLDGTRLGQVLEETANRFRTPLAFPRMDLTLEKTAILGLLGVAASDAGKYHLSAPLSESTLDKLKGDMEQPLSSHLRSHVDSVAYIANETKLLPVGMSIGPFSLMTKLLADPITPICMAGTGETAADDDEIALVEQALEIASSFILRSLREQLQAGAKAIFIAEPAANKVYISPNQFESGSDIFDRYVMRYNHQIRSLLRDYNADLIFHCCGELVDGMVKKFGELDPAILSLGGSRVLWQDAAFLPGNIVLYGNLPSKSFYSDGIITLDQVKEKSLELTENMKRVGHPFILGTECDVLSVPGCQETIYRKAMAISNAECSH